MASNSLRVPVNHLAQTSLLSRATNQLLEYFTQLKQETTPLQNKIYKKDIRKLSEAVDSQAIHDLLLNEPGKFQRLFDYLNKLTCLVQNPVTNVEEKILEANKELVSSCKSKDQDTIKELIQAIHLCASYRIDRNLRALFIDNKAETSRDKLALYSKLGAIPFYDTGRDVLPLVNFELFKENFARLEWCNEQDEIAKTLVEMINATLDYELNIGANSYVTDFSGTTTTIEGLTNLYPNGIQGTPFELMINQDAIPERILERLEEEFDKVPLGEYHSLDVPGNLACLPDLDLFKSLVDFGFDFSQVDPKTGKTTLQRFFELPYQYLAPHNQHTYKPSLALAANDPSGDFRKILDRVIAKDPGLLQHKDKEGNNLLDSVIGSLEKYSPETIDYKKTPLVRYMIDVLRMTVTKK